MVTKKPTGGCGGPGSERASRFLSWTVEHDIVVKSIALCASFCLNGTIHPPQRENRDLFHRALHMGWPPQGARVRCEPPQGGAGLRVVYRRSAPFSSLVTTATDKKLTSTPCPLLQGQARRTLAALDGIQGEHEPCFFGGDLNESYWSVTPARILCTSVVSYASAASFLLLDKHSHIHTHTRAGRT